MKCRTPVLACLLIASLPMFANSADAGTKQGVYEYVVREATLDFNAAAAALEQQIEGSRYELLAKLDAGVPEDCSYRARVYVLHDEEYAARLLRANPQTGAFAVTLRINLFEDEQGLHVAIVNPVNINRTVLLDDDEHAPLADGARASLRKLIGEAVPGEASDRQFGQIRKKGYIGRTMGVMAGGSFAGKIELVNERPGAEFDLVVGKLRKGIDEGEGKWDMGLAYTLVLEEQGVAVLGMSSDSIEAKSFSIVKQGADSSRKKLACPGIAHAAAYPIEVVVSTGAEGVNIVTVDSMYRMKMYFEDAGKWAFMKNMGMPGSIGGEMEERINGSLK